MRLSQPSLRRFGWAFPITLAACWAALALYMVFDLPPEQQPATAHDWAVRFFANVIVFVPILLLARGGTLFLLVAAAIALIAASLRRGKPTGGPALADIARTAPCPTEGTATSYPGARRLSSDWLSRTVGGLLIALMLPVGAWLLLMIVLSAFVWDGCPDTGCHMTGVWVADAMFGGGWLLAFCVAWIGYTQTDRERVPAWGYPLVGWGFLIVFVLVGWQIAQAAQHANARQ